MHHIIRVVWYMGKRNKNEYFIFIIICYGMEMNLRFHFYCLDELMNDYLFSFQC